MPVHRYSVVICPFSGPLGVFGSDIRKQDTAEASGTWGGVGVPVSLMNRFNQIESAVFQLCRFTLFPTDPLFSLFITVTI